jgi:ATP-dependent protease ClpP protease subunit
MSLMGFATIDGAGAATTFIAADCKIWHHDEQLPGKVFLARRRHDDEVAAAFRTAESWIACGDLAPLARRGDLGVSADVDDANGLAIVTSVYIHGNRAGSAVWVAGQDRSTLSDCARNWLGAVLVGRMGDSLVMPPITDRPRGEGDAIHIELVGAIGEGANSADAIIAQIRAAEGRSIALTIDSDGGNVEQGLRIYHALVSHPFAVFANITGHANSMAAIIALAADHREIAADGSMLLHQPALPTGTRAEAGNLRRLATRLDGLTDDFSAIVATRAGVSLEIARTWIDDAFTFNAGEAIGAGLCHTVNRDVAPILSKPPRAKFAAISAPFTAARPARKTPPLYSLGEAVTTGEMRRHNGRAYVAVRNTRAAPDRDRDAWERV